jgi:hypothetical protein
MEPINIDKSRMEWIQVLEDAGEVPVLKRLQVRIYNSTHPPFKLKILPGTKVSAVLAYLNLDGDYVLYPISDPAKTFSPEEALWPNSKRSEAYHQTVPGSRSKVCTTLYSVRRNRYGETNCN